VDAFRGWPLDGEVIIVDDGGGGFEGSRGLPPCTSLIRLPTNRGKGAAVREGISQSRGQIVAYTDVDLPFGVEVIRQGARFIAERGFHLVLGDRWLPASRFNQPRTVPRRFLSRLSASAVGGFLTGGFADTQCGLKVLDGSIARTLFSHFVIDGFAFDVELVHAALALGLDIKRVPVTQETDGPSSVRVFRHSAQALRDLVRIRLRGKENVKRFQPILDAISRDDGNTARGDS
jgi:glycosyltransferase involved in cell wall biosynthesis